MPTGDGWVAGLGATHMTKWNRNDVDDVTRLFLTCPLEEAGFDGIRLAAIRGHLFRG